jgi:hypothetical protein
MKSFLSLLSLTLVFASCSSAYKIGQTPDDVYFSPERPQAEYVQADNDEDRYYGSEQNGSSNDYYNYEEERYLRMKVRNRNRWMYLDNDFYSYNPYYYNNYSYYYNSPWNSYSYWNQYYNPYSHQVIVYNPKAPLSNTPRTINLRVFDNNQNTTNRTGSYNQTRNSGAKTNSNSAPRRNVGNDLRNIFNNGNSTNTPSSSGNNSSRMSTNSSSSSSSSSSGSSSGSSSAPARRF